MSRKRKIEQEAAENKELLEVSMFRLEERVLFDGAAAADVVAAEQQAEAEIAEAKEADHAADEKSADEKSGAAAQPEEASDGLSGYLEVAASGNIAIQTALESSTQIKVLFVADLDRAEALAGSAEEYNIIISFDPGSTSSAQLLDALNSALEGGKADAVGFMVDPATQGAMEAFSSEAGAEFWDGVNNALSAQGSIDLFGDADDTYAAETISAEYDRTVTVSTMNGSGEWNAVYTVEADGYGGGLKDSVDLDDTLFEQEFLDSLDMLNNNPDESRGVAFISRDTHNLDTILNNLGEDIDLVILDPAQDTLQQITDYLNDTADVQYSSLHFFAPGSTDALNFNGDAISAADLAEFNNEIVSWRNAMTDHASINIYGGDMAATESGRDFLDHLMAATGAEVEISDAFAGLDMAFAPDYDPTALNDSAAEVLDYAYNINRSPNTYYVVNNADSGEGSLRWALEQANQDLGLDYIEFQLEDGSTIDIDSSSLYITDSVIINSSSLNITIDGSSLGESLFVVNDGDAANQIYVEINNLNIHGASAAGVENALGGAIQNHEALNLNGVIIQNSEAQRGGAIWNDVDAKLVIESSKFIGNSALEGGAIYNHGGEVYINDSYFSGNTALNGAAISSVNTGTSQASLEIHDSIFDGNFNLSSTGATVYSEGISLTTGIENINEIAPLELGDGKNVVFINSSVFGKDTLIEQLGDNTEVVILEPGDAFAQITEYLAGKSGYSAIHIITHGNEGYFLLGGDSIDQEFVEKHADSFSTWGDALVSGGDIMIYGCNTAGSDAGKALIQSLAAITGCDVAASTNATGLGGDWILEYSIGAIQVASLGIVSYNYRLANIVVNVADDIYNLPDGLYSLRRAINDSIDGGSITFADYANMIYNYGQAGQATGTDQFKMELGQIEITKNITIDGQIRLPTGAYTRAYVYYENHATANRIFFINANSTGDSEVNISNMDLRGGVAPNVVSGGIEASKGAGGAMFISTTSKVTLTDVSFRENSAVNGGAIYNAGNLLVKSLTTIWDGFFNNTASTSGGAIFNQGTLNIGGTLDDTNTYAKMEFHGNRANNGDGGAIYSTGDIVVKIVDFQSNYASAAGGAIAISNGGAATVIDVIDATSNTAGSFGGAIYFANGNTLKVISSHFTSNQARSGGAIYFVNSDSLYVGTASGDLYPDLEVGTSSNSHTFFRSNRATSGNGGAIYMEGTSIAEFHSDFTEFTNNTATQYGGALYFIGAGKKIDLLDTMFESNRATSGNGGAIYANSTNNVTMIMNSSSFGKNTATSGNGGAIFLQKGSINSANMTFGENGAVNGGAIYVATKLVDPDWPEAQPHYNFDFNTFAYNTASGQGSVIYVANGSTLRFNASIIYDTDSGSIATKARIWGGNVTTLTVKDSVYGYFGPDNEVAGNTMTVTGEGLNEDADSIYNKQSHIAGHLFLDTDFRYHANYRTKAYAVLYKESMAYKAVAVDSVNFKYDQRGNLRGNSTWDQYLPGMTAIGAFDPIFSVLVSDDGDNSSWYFSNNKDMYRFDSAYGATGLNLREAIYWIDTFDRSAAYDLKPGGAMYDNTRFVHFSKAFLDQGTTITLRAGMLTVGFDYFSGNLGAEDIRSTNDKTKEIMISNGEVIDPTDSRDYDEGDYRDPAYGGQWDTRITISGGNSTRILTVFRGNTVYWNNIDMANGRAQTTIGTNEFINFADSRGGAVWNLPTARIIMNNTVIKDSIAINTIINNTYYNGGFGGGIYNMGSMQLYDCTITNNTASSGGYDKSIPEQSGYGGGIYNEGSMIIERSTISYNTATGVTQYVVDPIKGAGIYQGDSTGGLGGLIGMGSRSLSIANSTIVENTATLNAVKAGDSGAGAGIYVKDGSLGIYYTTVVGNRTNLANGAMDGSDTTLADKFAAIAVNGTGINKGIITASGSIFANNSVQVNNPTKLYYLRDIYTASAANGQATSGGNYINNYNIIGYFNRTGDHFDFTIGGDSNNIFGIAGGVNDGYVQNLRLEEYVDSSNARHYQLAYLGGKTKSIRVLDYSVARLWDAHGWTLDLTDKGILFLTSLGVDQRGLQRNDGSNNNNIGSYAMLKKVEVKSNQDNLTEEDFYRSAGWDFTEDRGGWENENTTLRYAFLWADSGANITIADNPVWQSSNAVLLNGSHIVVKNSVTFNGELANGSRLSVSGDNKSRIFYIDNGTGETATVNLLNVSMQLGNGTSGTHETGKSVDGSGGAVYTLENLALTNVNVSNNTAAGNGGGVYALGVALSIKGTDGVRSEGSTVSEFHNNEATNGLGGALYVSAGGSLNIIDASFRYNTARLAGGGLYLNAITQVSIDSSVIGNNTSGNSGGGISGNSLANMTIVNTTIGNNMAALFGGGLYFNGGGYSLNFVTIANNTAGNPVGGGIYHNGGSINGISNSIIAQNAVSRTENDPFIKPETVINGADVYVYSVSSYGAAGNFGYNIIGGISGIARSNFGTNTWFVTDNPVDPWDIILKEVDLDTEIRQNGGGHNIGTIYVGPNSKAINNANQGSPIGYDQRYVERKVDEKTIGAYQRNEVVYYYNGVNDEDVNNTAKWVNRGTGESFFTETGHTDFETGVSDYRFVFDGKRGDEIHGYINADRVVIISDGWTVGQGNLVEIQDRYIVVDSTVAAFITVTMTSLDGTTIYGLEINNNYNSWGRNLSNSGNVTITVNGNVTSNTLIIQNNGGVLEFAGGNSTYPNVTVDASANGNKVIYSFAGNQNILENTYYDLVITGSGTKATSYIGTLRIRNDMTIDGDDSLTVDINANTLIVDKKLEFTGSSAMQLFGELTVRESFAGGTSTFIYDNDTHGASKAVATTITGTTTAIEYYNLILRGDNTKTGSGTLTVLNDMTIEDATNVVLRKVDSTGKVTGIGSLDVTGELTFTGAGRLRLNGDLLLGGLTAENSVVTLDYFQYDPDMSIRPQEISGGLTFNELRLIGEGGRNFKGNLATTGNLYVQASIDGTGEGSGDGATLSVQIDNMGDLTVGDSMTMGKYEQENSGFVSVILSNGNVDVANALSMYGKSYLSAQNEYTHNLFGNVTVGSLTMSGVGDGDEQRLSLHRQLSITRDMVEDVSLGAKSFVIYDGEENQNIIALNYNNVTAGGDGIKSWVADSNGRYGNIQNTLKIMAGSTFWTNQVLGTDNFPMNRLDRLVIEGSPDSSSPGGNLYLAGADDDSKHAIGNLLSRTIGDGALITYGGPKEQILEDWNYSTLTLILTDSNTKTYDGNLTVGNLVILSNDVTGVVTGNLTINGVDPSTVSYASGALWFLNDDDQPTEGMLEIGGNLLITNYDYFDFKAGEGTMHFNGGGDDFSQTVNNLNYWNLKISNADKVLDNRNATTVTNEFRFDGDASLLIQGFDLTVNELKNNAGNLNQYFIFNDGRAGSLGTGGKLLFSVEAGDYRQIAAGSGNINGGYWNELWFQNDESDEATVSLQILAWNDGTKDSENFIKQQFSIDSSNLLSFDVKGSNAVGRYYSDYFKALFQRYDTDWTQVSNWYAIDEYRELPGKSGIFAFGTADLGSIESSGYDPLVVTESHDWDYYVSDPLLGYLSQIGTLRFAVEYANMLDGLQNVTFEVNEVVLSHGELRIKDHLILGSMDKVGTLIRVDSAAAGQRIFVIANPERDIYVKIIGLNLTGGDATNVSTIDGVANVNGGGAIYNEENLELVRVNIYDNKGELGGGLYNAAGGNVHITDSSFMDNTAIVGGAIFNNSEMKTTEGKDAQGNATTTTALNKGEVLIYRSLFAGNTALGDTSRNITAMGGAIYSNYGVVYADNSTFTGNAGHSIVETSAWVDPDPDPENPDAKAQSINKDAGVTLVHITMALNTVGDGYLINVGNGTKLYVESSIITSASGDRRFNGNVDNIIAETNRNYFGTDNPGMFVSGGLIDDGGWTLSLALNINSATVKDYIIDRASGIYETDQRGYLANYSDVPVSGTGVRDYGAFEYRGGIGRNVDTGAVYVNFSQIANAGAGSQIELVGSRIKFNGSIILSKEITLSGVSSDTTFIDGKYLLADTDGSGSITIGSSAMVTFANLSFRNFVASSPSGGLFNVSNNSGLVLSDVTIHGVSGGAAAVVINSGGFAYFDRAHMAFNSGSQAGAIYNNGGTLLMERSNLYLNTSSNNGGAITGNGGEIQLNAVSIYRNRAVKGGGMYVDGGKLELTNATIAFNVVSDASGTTSALYFLGDEISMINNTIAYGMIFDPSTGNKIDNNKQALVVSAGEGTTINNLVLTNWKVDIPVNKLIDENNIFQINGQYLQDRMMMDNGGYVKTLALRSGSYAIDGGTNVGGTASDARGYDSAYQYASIQKGSSSIVRDIGAFEYNGTIGYYYQYSVAKISGEDVEDSYWMTISSLNGLSGSSTSGYSNAGKNELYVKLVNTRILAKDANINLYTSNTDGVTISRTVYLYGSEQGGTVLDAKYGSQVLTVNGATSSDAAGKIAQLTGNLIIQRVGLANGFVEGNGAAIGHKIKSGNGLSGTTDGNITIMESTLSGNIAIGGGGAIWADSVKEVSNLKFTIENSLLSNNRATDNGGAIGNRGTVSVTDSTLAYNIAFGHGGAISIAKGDGTSSTRISGSTISFNSSFGHGGGIYNSTTLDLVENTILARNRSTDMIVKAVFDHIGSGYDAIFSAYESGFDYYAVLDDKGVAAKLSSEKNNIVEYQNGHNVAKYPDTQETEVKDFFGQVAWEKENGVNKLKLKSADIIRFGTANGGISGTLFVDGNLRDNGGWSRTIATADGNIGMDKGSGEGNDQRGYLVNSPGPTKAKDIGAFEWGGGVARLSNGQTYSSWKEAMSGASSNNGGDMEVVNSRVIARGATYNGSGDLTITSLGGTKQLYSVGMLDGMHYGRILTLLNANANVTISNLMMQNGLSAYGTEARAGLGGAIYSASKSLTLNDVSIFSSLALSAGGALYSSGSVSVDTQGLQFGSGTAVKSRFGSRYNYNRTLGSGGGFYITGGTITATSIDDNRDLIRTEFEGNAASGHGGAFYFEQSTGNSHLMYINFISNTAGEGGAVHLSVGDLVHFEKVTFNSNIADTNGGALSGDISAEVKMTAVNIYNNRALFGDGGGVYLTSGSGTGAFTFYRPRWIGNRAFIISYSEVGGNEAVNGNGGAFYLSNLHGEATDENGNTMDDSGKAYGSVFVYSQNISDDVYMYNNTAHLSGGAIYAINTGDVTIGRTDSTVDFYQNTAVHGSGGAVYLNNIGNFTGRHHVWFRENTAYDSGGGLYILNAKNIDLISDVEFYRNTATYGSGGGAYLENVEDITMYSAKFYDNQTNYYGGGIYMKETGDVTISVSQFSWNAAYDGGAMYIENSQSRDITIGRSSFGYNRAYLTSAVYINTGNVDIDNTTFYYNYELSWLDADERWNYYFGAAVYLESGSLNLLNVTSSHNAFYSGRYAFQLDSGSFSVFNTLINDNYGVKFGSVSVTGSAYNIFTYYFNYSNTGLGSMNGSRVYAFRPDGTTDGAGAAIRDGNGNLVGGSSTYEFIENNLFLGEYMLQGDRLTYSLAIDSINSLAFRYSTNAAGTQVVRSGSTDYIKDYQYDQRGNMRTGLEIKVIEEGDYKGQVLISYYKWNEDTQSFEHFVLTESGERITDPIVINALHFKPMAVSIGAFEANFYMTVTSTGDSALEHHPDLIMHGDNEWGKIDYALIDGITLREAIYWIDSYDFMQFKDSSGQALADGDITRVRFDENRYVKFADSMFTSEASRTVKLTGGDIVINTHVIIGSIEGFEGDYLYYVGKDGKMYFQNDNTFKQQDNGQIVIDADGKNRIFQNNGMNVGVINMTLTNGAAFNDIGRYSFSQFYWSYGYDPSGNYTSFRSEDSTIASGGAILNRNGGHMVLYNTMVKDSLATNATPTHRSQIIYYSDGAYMAYGGGIYNDAYSTMELYYCTVTGNTADGSKMGSDDSTGSGRNAGWGGGIYNAGAMYINNSLIGAEGQNHSGGSAQGNKAIGRDTNDKVGADSGTGGGIYSNGYLYINNSTISGNTLEHSKVFDGSAITIRGKSETTQRWDAVQQKYVYDTTYFDGVLKMDGNTIVNNDTFVSGIKYGAAILVDSSARELRMTNNIIAENYVKGGVSQRRLDISIKTDKGLSIYEHHNIVGNWRTGANLFDFETQGDPFDILGPDSNIIDVNLCYNGGLTRNYRVLDGSVAIDGGDYGPHDGEGMVDQRGLLADGEFQKRTTIGAYERLSYVFMDSAVDRGSGYETMTDAALNNGDVYYDYSGSQNGWKTNLRYAVYLMDTDGDVVINVIKDPVTGKPYDTMMLTEGEIVIKSGLTIKTSNTADIFTIDADGGSRHFNILSTSSAVTVNLMNLTLKNGSGAGNGGSILANNSYLTLNLTNVNILKARADGSGGGLYFFGTALNTDNVVISGNRAGQDGGGIYIAGGNANINTAVMLDNTAEVHGGGIYFRGSNLMLEQSVIGNIDPRTGINAIRGGAIYVGTGNLSMLNSTLSNNNVSIDGGGIYFTGGGVVDINFSTIANNNAGASGGRGGGIFLQSFSTINLNNSIVAKNWSNSNQHDDIYSLKNAPAGSVITNNVIGYSQGIVINEGVAYNNIVLGLTGDYGWLHGELSPFTFDGRTTYVVGMEPNTYAIGRAKNPGTVLYDQAGQGRPEQNATAGAYEMNPEPHYDEIYLFIGGGDSDRIDDASNWRYWNGTGWDEITAIDFTGEGKIFTFGTDYTLTQAWDIDKNKIVLNLEGYPLTGDFHLTVNSSSVNGRFDVNGASTLEFMTAITVGNISLLSVSNDSTVVYNGNSHTVYSVRTGSYGNLEIIGGGTKTSGTAITVNGYLKVGSGTTLTVSSGDLTAKSLVYGGGNLNVKGNIAATGLGGTVNLGDVKAGGRVTLSGGADIVIGDGIEAGGNITLTGSGISVIGDVKSKGGNVNISAGGDINLSGGRMTGTGGVHVSGDALNLADYEIGTSTQGIDSLVVNEINALSGKNTINHFPDEGAQVTASISIASGAELYYNVGNVDTSIGMADGGNMFNLENITNDRGTFRVITTGNATLNGIEPGDLPYFNGVLSITCEDVNIEGENKFNEGNIDLVLNNSGWFNLGGTFEVRNDFTVNKIKVVGEESHAILQSTNGSIHVLNKVEAEDSRSNFTINAANDVQLGSVSNVNTLTVNADNILLQNNNPAEALLIDVGNAVFNSGGNPVDINGTIKAGHGVSFSHGIKVVGSSAISAGGSIDFGAGDITGSAGADLTLTSGNLMIDTNSIDMPGNLTVNGSLNVALNIDNVGNLTINNGLLSVDGNAKVNGALNLNGTGHSTVDGDLTVAGNINIQAGNRLTAANTGLGGSLNIANGAGFETNTLTLDGTAVQTLNLYGASNIMALVLNNSRAILNGDLTVNTFTFSDHGAQQFMINDGNTLMVTDGIGNAGWNNYFVMGNNALLKQMAGSGPLEFWVGSTAGASMIALSNGIVAGEAYGVGFKNSITNGNNPIRGSLDDTVKATWSIHSYGEHGIFDIRVDWSKVLNGETFDYQKAVYNLWINGAWKQENTLLPIEWVEDKKYFSAVLYGMGDSTFSITNQGVDMSDPHAPSALDYSRWLDEQRKFGPFEINVPPSIGEASWLAMQRHLESNVLTNPLGITSSPERTSMESDPRRARRVTVFGTPDGAYGVMGNDFANEVHYIEEEKISEEDMLEKLLQEYVGENGVSNEVFARHPGTMNDIDRALDQLLS